MPTRSLQTGDAGTRTPAGDGVARGYRESVEITRREAGNFYYAVLTLPAPRRRAMCAAYAFCRRCDDAVDEDGSREAKLSRLAELQAGLDAAYRGRSDIPLFLALADAARKYDIPQEYFNELLRGMERDMEQQRYEDFDELRQYCYQAAAVVGLVCIQIFGYKDDAAKTHAIDLGLAMQLTNIIRDVGEDMEMGRVYLPRTEMARFGYSEEELKEGIVNDAFVNLMKFQAERARGYFRSGFQLLPYLSPRSRPCPAIIARIYSRLLERIEARGFDVLRQRISLSKGEKARLAAQTWLTSQWPAARR